MFKSTHEEKKLLSNRLKRRHEPLDKTDLELLRQFSMIQVKPQLDINSPCISPHDPYEKAHKMSLKK